MSLEDELKALCALPCSCVQCPDCHGSGGDWEDHSSPCYYCDGAGVSELCTNCEAIAELQDVIDESRG